MTVLYYKLKVQNNTGSDYVDDETRTDIDHTEVRSQAGVLVASQQHHPDMWWPPFLYLSVPVTSVTSAPLHLCTSKPLLCSSMYLSVPLFMTLSSLYTSVHNPELHHRNVWWPPFFAILLCVTNCNRLLLFAPQVTRVYTLSSYHLTCCYTSADSRHHTLICEDQDHHSCTSVV